MKSNYSYLIVENIEEVCKGIESRMALYQNWGCIGYTGNITDAIVTISNHKPDLLFLDWSLNGGSGFEIWETIQNINDYNPYIIFNTGYQKDNPDIPVQLINNYKVDKYIVKPIWENLRKNLSQYLIEAEQKAACETTRKNYCIKNIYNKIEHVNLNNLTCILHDKTKPRFKSLYFIDKQLPIIINQNWQYCYTLLNNFKMDFFVTNDKNHLVIKQHIEKFEKPFIKLTGIAITIEVVKEKIRKFEDWLVK